MKFLYQSWYTTFDRLLSKKNLVYELCDCDKFSLWQITFQIFLEMFQEKFLQIISKLNLELGFQVVVRTAL